MSITKQAFLLLTFFAFIVLLLGSRIVLTSNYRYLFLLWNIFLAAIPYWLGNVITNNFKSLKNIALLVLWLLFYPNALYIVTDLMHLQHFSTLPIWYDVVLLFSCSVLGLILGFKSLWRLEKIIAGTAEKWKVQAFVIVTIILSSFGVYLGRFLRWNSWDIVSNPIDLMTSIGSRLLHPTDHPNTWAVTIILSVLYYLLYELSKANFWRNAD